MKLPEPFANALVLTGPTASGKTSLALDLARRLDAEIIAMDSMTLYRGMDIGTAKPALAERAAIPHHLIDVLDPWESGNVAWWLSEAGRCCRDIEQRGKQALFVGGTPFYLKALLQGLFDSPRVDPELRRRLEAEAAAVGASAFHARLTEVDPVSAARIHPNDVRRVVRALEVWQLTGKPLSSWQRQGWWSSTPGIGREGERESGRQGDKESGRQGDRESERQGEAVDSPSPPLPFSLSPCLLVSPSPCLPVSGVELHRCLVLDVPREELYVRIDRRVERMIEAGWLDEVRRLRELPRPWSKEASQALGYRELSAHLDGERGLAETIAAIQMRSRQFAKRQLTWFRHLPGCRLCQGELTFDLWRRRML